MFDRKTARNVTLLLGTALSVLVPAALSPILPDMAETFQDTPNAELLVRLALTLPSLTTAAGAPLVGYLLDRYGRKPVLLAALVAFGVSGASGYASTTLTGILVGRAALGLATAGTISGFTTLVADTFEGAQLNRFMGYQGAALGVGGVVGLVLGGILADTDWRLAFLMYLFAFVVLPGTLFAIDEPQRENTGGEDARPGEERFPVGAVLPVYAIALVSMVIFFIFPAYLPFLLTTRLGVSGSQIGVALSLQTLSSIAIGLGFQQIKARLSYLTISALIFLTFGINHLVIANLSGTGIVAASLLVGGIGLGLLAPNVNVWVASSAPQAVRGRAVGGLNAAIFVGQFITPLVTQPLAVQAGVPQTFAVAGVVSLVLTALFAGLAVRQSLTTT